jgi:hypothetical protein
MYNLYLTNVLSTDISTIIAFMVYINFPSRHQKLHSPPHYAIGPAMSGGSADVVKLNEIYYSAIPKRAVMCARSCGSL